MIGRHLRDNSIPCILNRLALLPFLLFFCMLSLYITMVARQLSSLEADPFRILRFLLPSIYHQERYSGIFFLLPEGYRKAPLIAFAHGTDNRRRLGQLVAKQAAAGRDRIDQAMAIQAAADQERIDQAMAIQAAADQERIDQAMAIQAAADQTIAENAEVCLMSFYTS